LPSSRRVKKGPGRRPQSAKRQRFVELRERGWSILAAAREVGVSRTTGAAGSASDQPEVPVAGRADRDRRSGSCGLEHPADRAPAGSGAFDGLARAAPQRDRGRGYRPFDAHRRATARRTRNYRRRIEANGELRQLVAELLGQRWSPQQISRHLRLKFPGQSGMWLCHESIYQAVYRPGSGLLRPSRLAPHRRSPLRTGRDHRRVHQRTERRRARFEHPMLTIHQRPFPPEDRSQPGHWESQ